MCNANYCVEALAVHDVDHLFCDDGSIVRLDVRGVVSIAVAKEVGYDGSVSFVLTLLYLVVPEVA